MVDDPELLCRLVTLIAIALLALAALHDVGFRTIPNSLSLALVACGLVRHLAVGDLGRAGLASTAVFAGCLIIWRVNALGGGDVKILGATSFAIPIDAIQVLILGTALAGGILALAFLALRPFVPATAGRRPRGLLSRVLRTEGWRIRRSGPLPYAVAIAAGGAVSLLHG